MTESFLGVVILDEIDRDWGFVILGRDEHFIYRAIKTEVSIESRDEARMELQMEMARLVGKPQRIFPQGMAADSE